MKKQVYTSTVCDNGLDYRLIRPIQKVILHRLLWIGITVGLVPLITGTVAAYQDGLWAVMAGNLLAYISVLILFTLKNRHFTLTRYGFIAVLALVGLILLLNVGMQGASLMWLFTPLALAVLLVHDRFILVLALGILISLSTVGMLLYYDKLPWDLPLHIWIVIETSFIAISLFLIISTRFLIQRLVQSLKKERMLNRKLRIAIDENETLIRELHHRVKNNLQLAVSLLRMECLNSHSEQVNNALGISETRITTMALSYSHIVRDEGRFLVNSEVLLQDLIEQIQLDQEYEMHIEPITITLEQAVPLSLIVEELLQMVSEGPARQSDAIESANWNIDISLRRYIQNGRTPEGLLRISCFDNSNDINDRINSRDRVGSTIVKLLTEQLHGNVTVTKDYPSIIELRFPVW